jgi:hypothetical protein
VSLDELGIERDGRERVLDLMRDTACDLLPGTLALGTEQFSGVFDDQNVPEMIASGGCGVFKNRNGCGEVLEAGCGVHLHLVGRRAHAMRAAQQAVQRIDDVRRQHSGEIEADELLLAAGIEQLGESSIGDNDVAIGRQRYNAGGNSLDDGLELGATRLEVGVQTRELRGRVLGDVVRRFKIGGHVVEAFDEFAELFGG